MKKAILGVLILISIDSFSQPELIPCNEVTDPIKAIKDASMQAYKERVTSEEVTEEYISVTLGMSRATFFFKNLPEFSFKAGKDYVLTFKDRSTRYRIILRDRQTAIEAASAALCLIESSGNNSCKIRVYGE